MSEALRFEGRPHGDGIESARAGLQHNLDLGSAGVVTMYRRD